MRGRANGGFVRQVFEVGFLEPKGAACQGIQVHGGVQGCRSQMDSENAAPALRVRQIDGDLPGVRIPIIIMSSWRNGIVPFAMKGIRRDRQRVECFIRHDDAGRIRPASYSACTVRPVVVALAIHWTRVSKLVSGRRARRE